MNTELMLQLVTIAVPAALTGFAVGVLYGRGTASKAVHYEEPMEWQEPEIKVTRLTSRNRRVDI